MRKIYLFCASGMSTSVLVKKMEEEAKKQGYAVEIAAYSITDVAKYGAEADIILLGPQIRFQLKRVSAQFPDKKVCVINMQDYGMMNGQAVIHFVREQLGD